MTRHYNAQSLVLLATMLAFSVAARAQPVDYGSLEQLFGEPITTSVTGKPQKASDAPADIVILTQDDIRRSGADTIPDILRFVTGLNIRTYGIGDQSVSIRGYNQPMNPRLLVMVDGRQVYLDDYGYVAWNAIPVQLDEIRQIEIIKGPNSALFGFNAASGVINIITTDPIKDTLNAITVRTGTQGLAEASIVSTVHLGANAGLRVSAGGFTSRDFEPRGLSDYDIADRPAPRNGTFNARGSWDVQPGIRLNAEAGVVDSTVGVFDPEGTYLGTRYRISTARVGASFDSRIGVLDFDFYRNQAQNSYTVEGVVEDLVNTVYVAKASDLLKLDADNTIRLGLEYRNNAAASQTIFNGTIGYQVYSANAMWDWQVLPSVSLTNAVRVDHLALHLDGTPYAGLGLTAAQYNQTTITEPSFNSGLVWRVTEKDTIRLTAARGLQTPSLIDYAFQLAIPGITLHGSPTLAPTAVWNYELGYERDVTWLNSTVKTATFFQRNVSLLAASFSLPLTAAAAASGSLQSGNIGSSDEVGLEVGINGKSDNGFRWNASYSFASITDHLISGLATAPNLDYNHGTPQHTVIVGGGYSVGKWELDAEGEWQSSYQDFKAAPTGLSIQPVRVGNYVTFNARVGYRVTDFLTISGTAQQFNVSKLVETAGPPVERRFIIAATARF